MLTSSRRQHGFPTSRKVRQTTSPNGASPRSRNSTTSGASPRDSSALPRGPSCWMAHPSCCWRQLKQNTLTFSWSAIVGSAAWPDCTSAVSPTTSPTTRCDPWPSSRHRPPRPSGNDRRWHRRLSGKRRSRAVVRQHCRRAVGPSDRSDGLRAPPRMGAQQRSKELASQSRTPRERMDRTAAAREGAGADSDRARHSPSRRHCRRRSRAGAAHRGRHPRARRLCRHALGRGRGATRAPRWTPGGAGAGTGPSCSADGWGRSELTTLVHRVLSPKPVARGVSELVHAS